MSKKPKIIVILGPTSSGKSDVAIRLAKKLDGEIISADSRQIYRGMDVGTGKVEADQSAEIPQRFTNSKSSAGSRRNTPFFSKGVRHHMIDIVSPKTRFSAAQFKKKVDKIIPEIISRGKLPIICGGTGFWIKAIVDNVTYPEVKPDWKLRNKLRNKTAPHLFAMLKKLDPSRARNIDKNNKVRLIRAIEIAKKLGSVPKLKSNSKLVNSNLDKNPNYQLPITNYDFLQIGITTTKDALHKKIRKRLRERFNAGMIEEVSKLHKKGLSWKKIQSFGLGYFWIPLYLRNKIHPVEYDEKRRPPKAEFNRAREELFEKIYQAEKDYAKRQMTWFGKDKRIKWIGKYKDIFQTTLNYIR